MKLKGKEYSIFLILISLSIIFLSLVIGWGYLLIPAIIIVYWKIPSSRKKVDPIISFWIKYNKKIGNWEVKNLTFKKIISVWIKYYKKIGNWEVKNLNFKKIGYKTLLVYSVIAIILTMILISIYNTNNLKKIEDGKCRMTETWYNHITERYETKCDD